MKSQKKAKRRSRKSSEVVLTIFTKEPRVKAKKSGREQLVGDFDIVGVELKGISSVRVSTHPVQKPPPPPPSSPKRD